MQNLRRDRHPESPRLMAQVRELYKVKIMKYEVKIDDQKYMVDAPNSYEAKVQAARQHAKKTAKSANDVMTKSNIVVNKVEEAP